MNASLRVYSLGQDEINQYGVTWIVLKVEDRERPTEYVPICYSGQRNGDQPVEWEMSGELIGARFEKLRGVPLNEYLKQESKIDPMKQSVFGAITEKISESLLNLPLETVAGYSELKAWAEREPRIERDSRVGG